METEEESESEKYSEKCSENYSIRVLPFSIDPVHHQIYLLLGQESYYYKNTNRQFWCDFGGKMEKGETFSDTAQREFTEESMGFIYTNDSISNLIKCKDYIFKLKIQMLIQDDKKSIKKYNVTYMIEVPWQPQAEILFQESRLNFLYLDRLNKEKSTNILSHFDRLHPFLKHHPSIYINDHGYPNVKKEYLEKASIKYWGIHRLKWVLENGGNYKTDYFKTSFLPVLSVVIEALEKNWQNQNGIVSCEPI